MEFAGLHIFPYSDREHTAAQRFPDKVPGQIKRGRIHVLERLREELAAAARQKYIGKTLKVLIEDEDDDYWYGYSENYLKTRILKTTGRPPSCMINVIQPALIKSTEKEMLTANG